MTTPDDRPDDRPDDQVDDARRATARGTASTRLDPDDPAQRALVERAAAAIACPACGHAGLVVDWRLKASPLGSYSLAGHSLKVSARRVPFVRCPGCGIEGEAHQ